MTFPNPCINILYTFILVFDAACGVTGIPNLFRKLWLVDCEIPKTIAVMHWYIFLFAVFQTVLLTWFWTKCWTLSHPCLLTAFEDTPLIADYVPATSQQFMFTCGIIQTGFFHRSTTFSSIFCCPISDCLRHVAASNSQLVIFTESKSIPAKTLDILSLYQGYQIIDKIFVGEVKRCILLWSVNIWLWCFPQGSTGTCDGSMQTYAC